jgi:FMN reductase
MTSLVVVSAGLSNPSSTRLLADRLTAAIVAGLPAVEVTHVELRQLAHQLADQLLTGFPARELAAAQTAVHAADGLIVVTPVFAASYSGLFKMFFDVLPQGAVDGTPVLVAATAGTPRHSLVLDHALRPLFAYLHALVMPTGVFAAIDDFAGTDLDGRVSRAARELATELAGRGAHAHADPRPGNVDEQFAEPTPFEELLRQVSVGQRG